MCVCVCVGGGVGGGLFSASHCVLKIEEHNLFLFIVWESIKLSGHIFMRAPKWVLINTKCDWFQACFSFFAWRCNLYHIQKGESYSGCASIDIHLSLES